MAVDQEVTNSGNKANVIDKQIPVSLEDQTLWNKFQQLTNGMIVTKSGRNLFSFWFIILLLKREMEY